MKLTVKYAHAQGFIVVVLVGLFSGCRTDDTDVKNQSQRSGSADGTVSEVYNEVLKFSYEEFKTVKNMDDMQDVTLSLVAQDAGTTSLELSGSIRSADKIELEMISPDGQKSENVVYAGQMIGSLGESPGTYKIRYRFCSYPFRTHRAAPHCTQYKETSFHQSVASTAASVQKSKKLAELGNYLHSYAIATYQYLVLTQRCTMQNEEADKLIELSETSRRFLQATAADYSSTKIDTIAKIATQVVDATKAFQMGVGSVGECFHSQLAEASVVSMKQRVEQLQMSSEVAQH